jgi:hypothetical protein
MKQKKSTSSLDHMLSEHLQRKPAHLDFEQWAQKHAQALESLHAPKHHSARRPKVLTSMKWRTIMNSPMTKIAAATAIALAIFASLFPSNSGLLPSSVALADVEQAVMAQETLVATSTHTVTWQKKPAFIPPPFKGLFQKLGDEGPFQLTMNAEKYMSTEGFAARLYDINDKPVMFLGIDLKAKQATLLLPGVKGYMQFEIPKAYHPGLTGLSFEGMMNTMFRSENYRTAGSQQINGIEAVGFEVHDMVERFLGEFNPTLIKFFVNTERESVCVWVNPETRLPIRTDAEFDMNGCVITFFEKAHVSVVDEDFQWGLDIDESLFHPDIPDDYTKIEPPSVTQVGAAMSSVLIVSTFPLVLVLKRRQTRKAKTQDQL